MSRVRVPESVSVPMLQRFVEHRPLIVSHSQFPQASVGLSVLLQSIEHLAGSLGPDRLLCRPPQVEERLVMFGSTVDSQCCSLIREPIVRGELALGSLESPIYQRQIDPCGDLRLSCKIGVSLVNDWLHPVWRYIDGCGECGSATCSPLSDRDVVAHHQVDDGDSGGDQPTRDP